MDATGNTEVGIEAHPIAKKLIETCQHFFSEIDNLPGTPLYDSMSTCIRTGLTEGWVPTTEVDGAKYRRSKICLPSAENLYFSITTVYMDSEDDYSGKYHAHPYGEINFVMVLDEKAQLKGCRGGKGLGG